MKEIQEQRLKKIAALLGRVKRRRQKEDPPRKRPRRRRDPAVRIVGEIPGSLEEITYERPAGTMRGEKTPAGIYTHSFGSSAKMFAMSDGSLLIKPTGRSKLFEDIPD